MLDTLRNAAGTWVAKLLLGLLVVSFAVWGISGTLLQGPGANNVVTVGDTSVGMNEYRLAYDRQLSILSQQFGTRITREQARALGIDQQVLGQLVAGAVLDEQARKMNLGLSKDRLATLTAQDPAFQGADGRFSRQQFEFVLRQVGMRPEDYLANRAQVAVRQQIVEAVSDGIKAPDTFLKAVSLYQGEDRTVEYVVLPRSIVEPVEEPAADKLQAFFDERKASYAAPEYRKISYVKLEPADISDASAIAEEQIRADYEQNKAKFTTPERRAIQQLTFPDEAAAKAAKESLSAGTSFDQLVAAQGKTMADIALGTFEKARVPDPAVAEAAFALQPNQVSDVINGAFGPVLLRVTEVTPEVVKTFEEVRDQIRNELALAEANRILLEVHDAYEDARAAGSTMAEAAEKNRLKVTTVDAIDRTARLPDGSVLDTLPESQELLRLAFETEAGIENAAITTGANGYVFYEVDSITPKRDQTLDEVRSRVIADWKTAEATSRLDAKAAELRKQIDDGAAVATAAATVSAEAQTKRGLKRGSEDADLGTPGVRAAFGVAEGGTAVVTAPDETARIVLKVTEVFEPATSGAETLQEQTRTAFSSGMANDLLDQLVARLQTEFGVRVNQSAIDRALTF